MSRSVNGVSTILASARTICRIYGRFGAFGLTTETTPEFTAAVAAFVIACQVFMALDDFPGQIDHTAGGFGDDTD